MKGKITRIYLGLTFLLSWGTWIAAGVLTGSFQNGIESSPVMMGLTAAGMFVPMLSALLTNRLVPAEQRVDLCLRPRLRGNGKYYALAWTMPAAVTLVGSTCFFLLCPHCFDPSASSLRQALVQAGQSDELLVPVIAGQVFFALTLAPLVNALPAVGEEVGWRGLLYPLVAERMSKRKAVLATGAIWGIWHAPITAMGHNYGRAYPGFPVVGFVAMIVFCTSVGCLLAWLRDRTKSVWPCALAHGAINAIHNVGTVFCLQGQTILGPSPAGLVAGIPLFVLAIACWWHLDDSGR